MYITKEMDSFDVFHIREDATNEEIKSALKFHVEMYCGEDGNKRNRDGEYLLNIYKYHYKKLMDPVEKERLIEERKLERELGRLKCLDGNVFEKPAKNELVTSIIPKHKLNYIITSIYHEIIRKYSMENPQSKFSLKKAPLKDAYAVIGSDSSLMFTDCIYMGDSCFDHNSETGEIQQLVDARTYTLVDYFTRQNIFGEDKVFVWYNIPWEQGQIFKVNGILSTAFLASKIFPNALIYNGKIKDRDYRRSYDIIHNYLRNNSDYVSSLFENVDEKEVNKRMLL